MGSGGAAPGGVRTCGATAEHGLAGRATAREPDGDGVRGRSPRLTQPSVRVLKGRTTPLGATCAPGSSTAKGPTVRADLRVATHGLLDPGSGTDHAVDEAGVGPELGALADEGAPLQQRVREDRHVAGQLHGGVDVHSGRIDHRHTPSQPPRVDSAADGGLDLRQVQAVVDLGDLPCLADLHRTDRVARPDEHLHDASKTVLTVVGVGDEATQGRPERPAAYAVG